MLENVLDSGMQEVKKAILEVQEPELSLTEICLESCEFEVQKPIFESVRDTLKNMVLESYEKVEKFIDEIKEIYNSVKANYIDEEYNSPYKKETEIVEKVGVEYEDVVEVQKQAKQASMMGCGYKLWDVLEWFQYQFWKMTAEGGELQAMIAYELA